MSEYYRPVHKDGTHLAESNDTDGAYRGNLLDDETNRPVGNAEWVKVDDSELEDQYAYPVKSPRQEVELTPEQQELAELIGTAIAAGMTWLAVEVVAPGVKYLWQEKAAPALQAGWESLMNRRKEKKAEKKKGKIKAVEPKKTTSVSPAPASVETVPSMFVQELDTAYDNYVNDMTSEEAQRELLDIFILSAMLTAKVRKLKTARIVDGDNPAGYLDGQDIVNRLASSEFTSSINQILASNPVLLEEKASQISDFLGKILCWKVGFSQ